MYPNRQCFDKSQTYQKNQETHICDGRRIPVTDTFVKVGHVKEVSEIVNS